MERLVPERLSHLLRVADLPTKKPTAFLLEFDAEQRAGIADELGISGIKKLRFSGQVQAVGGHDWELSGELGATVVQPCVVTLDPVTTRLDENVRRLYVAEMPELDGTEIKMPEDDSVDELPSEIDVMDVMIEALSLALPQFPRKEDAELGEAVFAEPGVSAMTDDEAKPFSGLGALKNALEKKTDT